MTPDFTRSTLPQLLVAALVTVGCNTGPQPVASMYVKSGNIGPEGGTLTVLPSDSAKLAGTSIYIPAGALSTSVFITIAPSTVPVAQTGQTGVGPVVEFGPDGTMFASAATITLPINAGVSNSGLAIEAVETNGSSRNISIQSYANGFATFLTSTFTRFGGVTNSNSDGGAPDGGVTCSCPEIPANGCTVTGPAPCYCPVSCGDGGTSCASSADCTAGDYCATSVCGSGGTCQPEPQACPQDCSSPELCGCDGKLYCNSCLANAAGTSVAPDATSCGEPVDAGSPPRDGGVVCPCADIAAGACTVTGPGPCYCPTEVACDGGTTCTSNTDCAADSYCATASCSSGTCASLPGACPEYCVAPGVCGCNGQVYCNSCLANAAGTSVAPSSSTCGLAPDGGPASPDAGVVCGCPAIPTNACTVTGPGPCYCPTTVPCDAGPVSPQPNGTSCTDSNGAQCASGFCVDGVCCNNACTGSCTSCSESGRLGTCSAVTSGSCN